VIDLAYNPAQPRNRHGEWDGGFGEAASIEKKFSYRGGPGSMSHLRAIADLGDYYKPKGDTAEPSGLDLGAKNDIISNALHNTVRSVAMRDMRGANAHLDSAMRAAKGNPGQMANIMAVRKSLEKVPAGVRSGHSEPRRSRKGFQAAPLAYSRNYVPPGFKPVAAANFSNEVTMASPTSAAGRKAAFKAGHAIPPPAKGAAPGFPITSGAQWDKARDAAGRAGSPARRAMLARLLRRTASQFGRTQALAQSWAAPSGGTKNMSNALSFAGTIDGMECPSCNSANDADAKYCDQCGTRMDNSSALRTPVNASNQRSAGFSENQLSNTGRPAVELARRMPIGSPYDVLVSRGSDRQAVVRHRRDGRLIGEIRKTDDGWVSTPDGGKATSARTHQRGALIDLLSAYNHGTTTMEHRAAPAAGTPLQPAPVQTSLMAQYDVPAVRTFATPSAGASDGPRVTTAASSDSGDSGGDTAGLTPKGLTIYRKLKAKGFPAARALAFARRAQSFGGSK
jgi:hypothetical protein